MTFAGQAGYSKAAPFMVYDNTTLRGSASINEGILVTKPQAGRTAGSYGGVGWIKLGTNFTIQSGTLNVVLNNRAGLNDVDADGVLLVALATPKVVLGGFSASKPLIAQIVSVGALDST